MKKMLLMGLILSVITLIGCEKESYVEGTFSSKVGQFQVITLVEAERDGNTGILVGADEDVLSRYIPAEGFKHTANAFLIKAPGQNILIDTGTGVDDILTGRIKELGIELENISAVLITHLHGDHFGGLQKDGNAVFPNATVYLSTRELEYFTVTNVNQRAVDALAPYSNQIVTFEPSALDLEQKAELLPGITPIAAYGHTPGHTVFQIESNGAKFLVIGDLLHLALVQFAIPEISATFDIDPAAAARTRRQVLSYAAENKIMIGGMHIVYPGAGMVETDDSGFKFIPAK